MPERPFLPFPKAIPERRVKLTAGGSKILVPSPTAQARRLDKKFEDIVAAFKDLQAGVDGIEPEQIIVLETQGQSVDNLASAAARIPGLEWLAELDLGDKNPDDGFQDAKKPEKPLPVRLYAVMTNQKAMNDLLGLWKRWVRDPRRRADSGFGPFKNIFIHLKDVRRWSTQDRLAETGVIQDWEARFQYEKKAIRFEVELWCRGQEAARARAFANLEKLVATEQGKCIAQVAIPDILYHGVLAELPAAAVERTIEKIRTEEYTELLRCEDVMFFRPKGQAAFPISTEEAVPRPAGALPNRPPESSEPVVALLDGHPLAAHERLDGRLRIDDPDGLGQRYEPAQQQHGTAMASLIVHGDLSKPGEVLDRPVYVRPVLVPQNVNGELQEITPDDVLLADLFHRAIIGLKGTDEEPGAAPGVHIVNLSFGNTFQPFDRNLSPLAKLLDWLAWKYNLLILVSAGNQSRPITIEATAANWNTLSEEDLRKQTLRALWKEQVFRRPFSPAEAINCLTVGAWHSDESTPVVPDRRVDLWKGAPMPSLLSTVAAGFQQAPKPEIFFPGGRQRFNPPPAPTQEAACFRCAPSTRAPGILAAAPGALPMELNRMAHSCGSSNATALTSRCAALALRRLEQLQGTLGWERLTEDYYPVLLKTLLVHGASWGAAAEFVDEALGLGATQWQARDRARMRFLGYGAVEQEKALFGTDERATVLGWDLIGAEQGHLYRFPLPPCLVAQKVLRRVSVTLAWLTPINPFHSSYRKASVWFSINGLELLRVEKAGLDSKSAQRGTVQHQVFEGEAATAFKEGAQLVIKVNCMPDAGKLTQAIRYGLVVSLETAPGITFPVFAEVEERVRERVVLMPRP